MSFIDGVGDEVTAFFVIFIVISLATLVTFLGNGSNLYNITPTHTNTVAIRPVTNARQTNREVTVERRPETDRSLIVANHSSIQQVSENGQYQEAASDARTGEEEEASDESEERSSSEVEESEHENSEVQQSDTVTAPMQENRTSEEPSRNSLDIRIRLKYLDDTERTVISSPYIQIGEFKRNHFPDDLANNKVVRLIFAGHLLRDTSTLQSNRVVDNSVLHVQILQAQTNSNNMSVNHSSELDLSHLFWPLLIAILVLCWGFYFNFPQFFSAMSLGILGLFSIALPSIWYYTYRHE